VTRTAWGRGLTTRTDDGTTLDAWFGHGPLQAGVLAWQRERGAPEVPVRLLVGAAGTGSGRTRWVALQRDLARRLGAPEPQLLDDAGHLVTIDRPDAIADAVRALLDVGGAATPGSATAAWTPNGSGSVVSASLR